MMCFRDKKFCLLVGAFLISSALPLFAFAQQGPSTLNLSGGLFNSNGTPMLHNPVNFKVQIYDKSGVCLLYSEEHLGINLIPTKGAFSIQVGGGSTQVNNVDTSTNFNAKIFENPGGTVVVAGCAGGIPLLPGDDRLIRIAYDLGSGFVTMTPDVPITSAPYAMVAETLQGKAPTDLIQVHSDVNNALTQANAEFAFSATNFPLLQALLNGTSSQYLVTSPAAVIQ